MVGHCHLSFPTTVSLAPDSSSPARFSTSCSTWQRWCRPPSTSMTQQSLTLQLLVSGLNTLTWGRYCLTATYVVCFYDWIISLDQEIALIYPAPWNLVKCAYLFCRYFPMAIAPFHFWGFLGDHEQHVCESYYHALYACIIPTILSAQFILMLRTYAFSGRRKGVLAVLSITFFALVGINIWVISKQLTLSLSFVILERTSCFAVSDQPTLGALLSSNGIQGIDTIQVPIAYHLGTISIFMTFFDCLNVFIVVLHCVRRGTLGPLGRSFLKQGLLVYVVTTALNALSIAAFLSSYLVHEGLGSFVWLSYILPSALSCRLVITLRQEASPTETELRAERSHMVNEVIEMVDMDSHPGKTSESFVPSTSMDSQTQP
ncbi:hypothetical protein EI94DRAFT_1715410 [Lactarius quietus]|nr:hypothetical protein EI94DRAFT_1715410 [Lactarius quietus]